MNKMMKLFTVALSLLAVYGHVQAAPGDILFYDDFERSNPGVVGNGWVVTAAAGACTGAAPSVISPAVYPSATITVAGNQAVPVNGITVGGLQIMATFAEGSGTLKTIAANIRDQINACTAAITGNCTVAGYSASRSNGVVTITGPANASGSPLLALGTPTVGGTTETFATTAFTAYTPAVTSGGNTGCAGIDADTPPWNSSKLPLAPRANDNSKTMFTRWATVTVDSPVIDLSGKAGAQITYWVRRGSDCFSEWPGNNSAGCNDVLKPFNSLLGEEFQTQYKNSAGTWVVLSQFPTDAMPGEIFRPIIDLPADALWSGFQLRFRQPSGSGFNGSAGAPNVVGYDYWHLDDVKVTELAATNSTGAFCDTFEGDLSRWTFTGAGNAAIGSKYFQNGQHDLDIRWGAVTVTSKPTDMTGATGKIQFWVKQGIGNVPKAPNTTGSDVPEAGKDLLVEYLTTTAGVWKPLVPTTTFVGVPKNGTGGQVWCATAGPNCTTATPGTNSITIPTDANLTEFQLRFRLLAGAGYDQDYWHVDDVCLGTVVTGTDLSLTMAPTGTTTLAPGANSNITFTVTNNGPNIEPGQITITDTLPAGLSFVSSGNWSTGSWPSGFTGCVAVGQDLTCTRSGALAVGASTKLTITVHADAVASGTVTNSARVGGQSNETVPADNTATNTYSFTSANFKAYETTTVAGAVVGSIFTKLAGTQFNLKVIAINSGAINTTYNKQVTVDLIDGTAASCSSATALAGTTVTTSPYTYDMTDNGVHTFTFTSTNAYSNVQVRIKDNTSTDCTSDHFSIRPSTFTITSTDAGNNAASGNPMIKAGATFNLTATALAGYDGTPLIDNAKVIGSPTAGTLSGSFAAAAVATGIATPATGSFTYSEVGNFGLSQNAVYDASFTTIDQGSGDCVATDPSGTGANFSNTLDANGQYGCYIGSVAVAQTTGSSGFGRFIPDHFDTLINLVLGVPMPCGAGLTCPTTYHGMVYEKQPFSLTVTAMNASGVVTTNYNTTSGYSKTVTLSAYDALGGGALLANGALGITSVTAFGSGTITELNEKYTFAAVPTTPTNIYIRASDSDGASSLRTTALNSIEGGVAVVSGRTSISNANGSELLPLQMTATVQFYNAAGSWVTSTTDSLSSYSTVSNLLASIVTPPATTLTAGQISAKNAGTVTMGGGVSKFTLNAPGVSGKASISLSAPSYLPSTAGIATFGIFPGRKEIIYMRENY